MHGDTKGASFAKSNHPAKKKSAKGLSGLPGKTGTHPDLVGKENPHSRTKDQKAGMKKGKPSPSEKSYGGENPLFHSGNKMAKG